MQKILSISIIYFGKPFISNKQFSKIVKFKNYQNTFVHFYQLEILSIIEEVE